MSLSRLSVEANALQNTKESEERYSHLLYLQKKANSLKNVNPPIRQYVQDSEAQIVASEIS